MLKLLVKLAVAALIANAVWRVGTAYMQYYRFTDAVTQTAQFGTEKSRTDQPQRIVELASQYDVPLAENDFTVQRDERNHTLIDGSYTKPLDLMPGYQYQWPFTLHVDVLNVGALHPASP
jgi:outer membrane receptor for ferric coprogen and ferric-rhodotorulic acid